MVPLILDISRDGRRCWLTVNVDSVWQLDLGFYPRLLAVVSFFAVLLLHQCSVFVPKASLGWFSPFFVQPQCRASSRPRRRRLDPPRSGKSPGHLTDIRIFRGAGQTRR